MHWTWLTSPNLSWDWRGLQGADCHNYAMNKVIWYAFLLKFQWIVKSKAQTEVKPVSIKLNCCSSVRSIPLLLGIWLVVGTIVDISIMTTQPFRTQEPIESSTSIPQAVAPQEADQAVQPSSKASPSTPHSSSKTSQLQPVRPSTPSTTQPQQSQTSPLGSTQQASSLPVTPRSPTIKPKRKRLERARFSFSRTVVLMLNNSLIHSFIHSSSSSSSSSSQSTKNTNRTTTPSLLSCYLLRSDMES